MEKDKKNNPGLDIELPEELAEGFFTNFSIIAHSDAEFVIDFVRIIPGMMKGKIKARIIFNPIHAKQFNELLTQQIHTYEKQFGEIELPKELLINIDKPLGQA